LLPDRVLPSIDPLSPGHADYSVEFTDPEIERMRFMEVPESAPLLQYWESGAFSLSAKEILDIIGVPSRAEQLDPTAVTRGTVEIGGEVLPTLNLSFGSSVTACLVFAGEGVGSSGNPNPGFAKPASPDLLGGILELDADGGVRRFLMDYRDPERAGPGALFQLLIAERTADNKATQPTPGGQPAVGAPEPAEASPLSGTTGPTLALFVAGWAVGTQTAGGLSTPSVDDAGVNATAEVAVHPPGNPADVLLTVDTVLPDAKDDLVRLQTADLAAVPTYVVGTAPATPVAPPRADGPADLGLAVRVVGLDEVPGDGNLTPTSTDRLFEQLARAEGGRGVSPWSLDLGGMQPGASDVGDTVQAAPQARESAVPTGAPPAFRKWLDGFLQQGEKGAVMVTVLALEGLMAIAYRRGMRPFRQGDPAKCLNLRVVGNKLHFP
jgi:hypothetical protein